jgi:hypothetical protein
MIYSRWLYTNSLLLFPIIMIIIFLFSFFYSILRCRLPISRGQIMLQKIIVIIIINSIVINTYSEKILFFP